jgi:hypothetical protein
MPQPRSRKSFTFRLQPYSNQLLAEVVDYLGALDREDAARKIGDALLMCLLPYARAQQNASPDDLHQVCWESCDSLHKHASTMRQALKVPQLFFSCSGQAWTHAPGSLPVQSHDGLPSPQKEATTSSQLPTPSQEFRPASAIQSQSTKEDIDSLF